MSRYWHLFVLIIAVVIQGCEDPISLASLPPDTRPPSVPPNIVLIMADDLGYETIGAYGGTSYQTPQIDALAQTGMRFTQAYSTPKCTPSRVQIMTGKYNFRNYIGFGLLDPAEHTFAHLLRDAGYRTAVVGKWQLYGLESQRQAVGRAGSSPTDAGFDEYALWQIDQNESRYKDPLLYINSTTPEVHAGAYGPDVFLDYIEDFMERYRDEPFFLYYPMVFTHKPHAPTPDHPDYTLIDPDTTSSTYFAANVAYMDKIIGQIVAQLDRLGLRDNTLLLFTGDNGTAKSVTSMFNGRPFQGGKGLTTDAGIHTPLIANWPGSIAPGQINDNLIDFTDVLPTLMDVAQMPLPPGFVTDGLSFYPQLIGEADSVRSWVFCHYDEHPENAEMARYVHNAEWKLYDTGAFYHITEDPFEEDPLSDWELQGEVRLLKADFQDVLDRMR